MKVFLADDEIVVREGIRESFPWDETPYTLVGEAPDGEMALPIIRDTNPDIVITDIKMPFMDGIELCTHKQNGISIHPPLAGRDALVYLVVNLIQYFNPPAPCGTGRNCNMAFVSRTSNFNPPAPCGTGHNSDAENLRTIVFQSTRPLRDGT